MNPSPDRTKGVRAIASVHKYPHVFSPVTIGRVEIENRIFMSAITTNFAAESLVTDRHVAFLAERAKGGLGLIVTEALEVHPSGLAGPGRLQVSDDRSLEGLGKLVAAVHECPTKVFAQITHSGHTLTWAPSGVPARPWEPVPHAMDPNEIDELDRCFEQAARRVVDSGFDGLEVHLGHGHLLHRFLSPVYNVRNDQYGGSYANRLRLPVRILTTVRRTVGGEFPMGIRISSDELGTAGPSITEMRQILKDILATVDLQFVDVSQSGAARYALQLPDMSYGPTPFLSAARSFTSIVGGRSLLTACRFNTLDEAEAALATEEIDLVGMSRAHIADPAIIRKARERRELEIRPCAACNYCAAGTIQGAVLECMVNPHAGHEQELLHDVGSTSHPRDILVIGGGPAGLEFARVASARGHTVTLWEQTSRLGGDLRTGSKGVGRADLGRLADYLEGEVMRARIHIDLERTGTVSEILGRSPDLVIVATGARDRTFCLEGGGAIPNSDLLLTDPVEGAGTTVIIDYESGWRSATAVETTARRRKVVVITPHDAFLKNINQFSRPTTLERLRERRVVVHVMCEPVRRCCGGRLVIRSLASGEEQILDDAGSLYQCLPRTSDSTLTAELNAEGVAAISIGDSRVASDIFSAIHEAYRVARAL